MSQGTPHAEEKENLGCLPLIVNEALLIFTSYLDGGDWSASHTSQFTPRSEHDTL